VTRALITGGAGFLGSHLCGRLLSEGWDIICIDSLLTGSEDNIAGYRSSPRFRFERLDATEHIHIDEPLDWVMHFASPAAPRDYLSHPIYTLKTGSLGTLRTLGLAKAKGARFLLASTSEVYGDPQVHPQPEGYWGNVNPVGPRSAYNEAKRFAEAMTMAFRRVHGVQVRVARIFNTYGPGMRQGDGRAVPTFLNQALTGEALTVHGDGTQIRSFCYIDDLMEGIWRLLQSGVEEPINLGNTEEVTVLRIAEMLRELVGSTSELKFVGRPEDDPEVRCPDITLARDRLGWSPKVSLVTGLKRTIEWAREEKGLRLTI
jgi:dTDP-glucose 4,6-dehydratase